MDDLRVFHRRYSDHYNPLGGARYIFTEGQLWLALGCGVAIGATLTMSILLVFPQVWDTLTKLR